MWAFSDESERANVMLMTVVLVPPGEIEAARARMRALLLPGQRRLHMSDESARRRRVALDTVNGMRGISAVTLRHRRAPGVDRALGRHLLVQAATGLLIGSGVTAWTLDHQDPAQRSRDRSSIARALRGVEGSLHPSYDHRPAHAEPMLWAADVLCWAAGAGGEWRRRVAAVLTVRDIGA